MPGATASTAAAAPANRAGLRGGQVSELSVIVPLPEPLFRIRIRRCAILSSTSFATIQRNTSCVRSYSLISNKCR